MICSTIEKEIVDACTKETIKAIIKDLDGDYFGILVDESKGISQKEQMALVLRYVNKNEELIESFLDIVHVGDTSARQLQKVIYSLLLDHSLYLSRLRGQGYDGAGNMQGEKHWDLLRQHQVEKLEELLKFGEILTRQGLNRERGLQRSGDTRWGSHFKTFENFMIIFSSIANVLKDMKEDSPHDLDKLAADVASELNKALQKKDQDIVNAMGLLNLSNRRLQTMRESGLESLMDEVSSFCVIDLQLQELNNRFDVVTSDLFLGMASLNPVDSFANFSKSKIMKLAEYYKSEFGDNELRDLSYQLDSFIVYARECDSKFLNLKGIKDLATMMAQTKLDQTWSLVYFLVKLALILYVATTSVESAFSTMKLIKNGLCNSIGEEFLNGCLVCKIERKIFENISNDAIIDRFQNMKSRRVQL
ncbi:uncharacterized protein LOC125837850 [Solanum verrucosum]|uniref:uncharacterized protein LOC125837850 n=1 Tax=Solanum verrucosum TaxID=315347 RepID=UPI0020D05EAD|nr:uncharacterized protein LOC125837850 [Solanum verrucosum]